MASANVTWSPDALADLEAIVQYIALDSPSNALKFADRVANTVGYLEAFPTMGRRIPLFDDNRFREVLAPPYRIMYRYDFGNVLIIRMVHGARDLAEIPRLDPD